MPKNLSRPELAAFIKDREWNLSQCWGESLIRAEDVYQLQRFIYENLARHAKVVAHIIDGLHWMAAVELACVGFINDNSEKQLIQEYAKKRLMHWPKSTFVIVFKQK